MDSSVQSTTTNIFVGNLPFRFDDRDLRDLFAPYGECRGERDRATRG
jgi:RNA recognition motif-containing protein